MTVLHPLILAVCRLSLEEEDLLVLVVVVVMVVAAAGVAAGIGFALHRPLCSLAHRRCNPRVMATIAMDPSLSILQNASQPPSHTCSSVPMPPSLSSIASRYDCYRMPMARKREVGGAASGCGCSVTSR